MLPILLALAATTSEAPLSDVRIGVHPELGYQLGREEMLLRVDYGGGSLARIVDAPVDLVRIGASLRVLAGPLTGVLSAGTNLGAPGRASGDDWDTTTDGRSAPRERFRARVEARVFTLEAVARARLASESAWVSAHAVVAFAYESEVQKLFERRGWGTLPNGGHTTTVDAPGVQGGADRWRRLLPQLGLRFDGHPASVAWAFEARGLASFAAYEVTRTDSGISVEGNARGFGWSAAVEGGYDFAPTARESYVLGLRAELRSWIETGAATWRYASDYTDTPRDERSLWYPVATRTTHVRAQISVYVDAAF